MANRIFYNGYIYTLNRRNTVAEAMYIENDKIKFIGTNEEVQKFEFKADGIIDLNKRTVVPGFIDSHMHLLACGDSLNQVNLSECKSIDEVISVCKRFMIDNKIDDTKWLVGFGWNQENFVEKRMLTKHDLDKISRDIPIVLNRACLHVLTCNSKALDIANITNQTVIEGGEVGIANNDTTGILSENAASLIDIYMPKLTREDKKDLVLKAMDRLSSYGVTTVHTDDLGIENGGLEMLDIFKELEEEDRLKVRICVQSRITSIEEARNYFDVGYDKYKGSEYYKINSIKLLGDGSLGGQTAAMNEPYENSNNIGIALFTQDELDDIVELAHIHDVPVVIHAIGDRTIDMAINSFEKAKKKYPAHNVRHGVVHCQITSKEALDRIKENKILAYIQPIFVAADSKIVERVVGKERAKYSYNWKTLNDSKVLITFGTDSPVESPNPYENIYCAVTRQDLEGKPEGGFNTHQCLTVEESMKAYTLNGAYASYEEDIKGSLEVDKLADFTVLSDNIFEVKKSDIKNIKSIMTVMGGRIVYDK